ncbi:MAG: hypothetical protein DMG21_02385 [Acidobacteria bacterium]|nr:MAG: hypothetical protein DMG21_02385 [Acidobacteriota bacterium]
MKRLSVSELTPDSSIQSLFLVQSKERKVSANGSAYLDLELRDATGAIKAKVWDADRLRAEFEAGEVVRVDGRVDTYKGAPQIIVRTIARCRPEGAARIRRQWPRGSASACGGRPKGPSVPSCFRWSRTPVLLRDLNSPPPPPPSITPTWADCSNTFCRSSSLATWFATITRRLTAS